MRIYFSVLWTKNSYWTLKQFLIDNITKLFADQTELSSLPKGCISENKCIKIMRYVHGNSFFCVKQVLSVMLTTLFLARRIISVVTFVFCSQNFGRVVRTCTDGILSDYECKLSAVWLVSVWNPQTLIAVIKCVWNFLHSQTVEMLKHFPWCSTRMLSILQRANHVVKLSLPNIFYAHCIDIYLKSVS